MTRIGLAGWIVACAVALAGCGDGGAGSSDGGSTSDGGDGIDAAATDGATGPDDGAVAVDAVAPSGDATIADATAVDANTPAVDAGPGALCGTRGAPPCPAGQFCLFPRGAMCGATDLGGRCATISTEPCIEIYAPVCGCDGATYDNECFAHAAGTSVANDGVCAGDGVSCDHRRIRCRALEPVCPEGQVASVAGTCWGPCVAIDACVCSDAAQCPHEERFTCHRSAMRCGYYL